jgi:hypothetical protein
MAHPRQRRAFDLQLQRLSFCAEPLRVVSRPERLRRQSHSFCPAFESLVVGDANFWSKWRLPFGREGRTTLPEKIA